MRKHIGTIALLIFIFSVLAISYYFLMNDSGTALGVYYKKGIVSINRINNFISTSRNSFTYFSYSGVIFSKLEAKSELKVRKVAFAPNRMTVEYFLKKGKVFIETRQGDVKATFRIFVKNFVISTEGTKFSLNVDSMNNTEISLLEGKLFIEKLNLNIKAGQKVNISSGLEIARNSLSPEEKLSIESSLDSLHYTEIWNFQVPGLVTGPIQVFNNRIIFPASDGYIYSIDKFSGKKVWKRYISSPLNINPLISGNDLYIPTDNGTLFKLNANTGAIRWQKKISESGISKPVNYKDQVIIPSNDGFIYSISEKDGDLLWKIAFRDAVGSLALFRGDILNAISTNGIFYSISADDKKITWKYSISDKPALDLFIFNKYSLVCSKSGNIFVLIPNKKRIFWNFSIGKEILNPSFLPDSSLFLVLDSIYNIDMKRKSIRKIGRDFVLAFQREKDFVLIDRSGNIKFFKPEKSMLGQGFKFPYMPRKGLIEQNRFYMDIEGKGLVLYNIY